MSAFGQAGFGSLNRQNQLRAQGQLEPYGNQVRQAMQPMNMGAYSRQGSGFQPPAQQTQTVSPQPQQTGSPMARPVPQQTGALTPPATPGTAQPIPPANTGTPYLSSVSDTTSKPPIVNPNRPPRPTGPPARPTIQRPTNQRPMPTMGQAQPISSSDSAQERNWYGQMVDDATERFLSMPPGQRTQDYEGNRLMNDLWRASQGSGSAVDFTGRFQEARDQLQQYAVTPPPRRDNETAAETSARLNAETAYAQQQQILSQIAQQEQREQEFATRHIDYAGLPQNQPGYNPYPGGVTFADFWGPNAMQAQYWHSNYNPDGTPRIIGYGGGGADTPLKPIYGGR